MIAKQFGRAHENVEGVLEVPDNPVDEPATVRRDDGIRIYIGEVVEVLPDAPEPQPEERNWTRSLAARLIAVARDVYGNDTINAGLDAPTGHGLAAVIRVLADGPVIQTEWAAAALRKLADELEVEGR